MANATRNGLGGYVFDADVEHARRVASRAESGMVYVNSCFADSPGLPFCGVKNSGFGRELSEHRRIREPQAGAGGRSRLTPSHRAVSRRRRRDAQQAVRARRGPASRRVRGADGTVPA
ncbi:hypothetical protein GCM10018793_61580 [Streptomyces sulfonofaciens]|uniref:Aldehyde dehydrogenase domain-containing protein n=1 Tax=Streptomyces sulfonofaciens TaxID=68272 RepID=A0A919GNU3_9ACTN|nr:aldehyde dehydrogenase family protein [Streptomyces sulfonofaciens]GHH87105.1 hypothetical protein GCM10018793_61580 [Streptomyces sulfonofaciens]